MSSIVLSLPSIIEEDIGIVCTSLVAYYLQVPIITQVVLVKNSTCESSNLFPR